MNLILRVIVILAVASNSNAKAVDKQGKRGLYFGHMIECETGRSAFDYLDYGCYCGLGGAGTPADQLDSCCFAHDKCYDELLSTKTCNISFSLYSTTYKYNECSNCAKPSEYSWWDQFGYETVECRKGLCDCDAIAARCFKASTYNDALKDYDQEKCHM